MDTYARHRMIWSCLAKVVPPFLKCKFRLRAEPCRVEGPCIVISNHVMDWDPLLVACSFTDKHLYYMASEHLFRKGWLSKLIVWLLGPIARRKASSGADAAMQSLRHLRAGHSICIFAEGATSWDGRSQPIVPATGKLVKMSGASLVTYRLEGGYLSHPRWGRGNRRGRIYGHPVQVYPPEQLREMEPEAINALIERDIYEDAWQRQQEQPVAYKGRHPAECLETLLYLCPECGRVGGLQSRGDRVFCSCGFSRRYTDLGGFLPAEPFANLAEWEDWQQSRLSELSEPPQEPLFSDDELLLYQLKNGHQQRLLGRGALRQYADKLCFGEREFPLAEIINMAPVKKSVLLFSTRDSYYEIKAKRPRCLRKYFARWELAKTPALSE